MVQRYQEVGRKADGLGLHGVCLAQSVSVRAMNAAAVGGERPLLTERGRVFHPAPRRDLILCQGSGRARSSLRGRDRKIGVRVRTPKAVWEWESCAEQSRCQMSSGSMRMSEFSRFRISSTMRCRLAGPV